MLLAEAIQQCTDLCALVGIWVARPQLRSARQIIGPKPVEEPKNYINIKNTIASWLLTVDHKRIGLLYVITGLFFFVVGGLEAIVILDAQSREGSVVEDLYNLLERLTPVARRLGCVPELVGIEGILRDGAGYQRQRAAVAAAGGDLAAAVRAMTVR